MVGTVDCNLEKIIEDSIYNWYTLHHHKKITYNSEPSYPNLFIFDKVSINQIYYVKDETDPDE